MKPLVSVICISYNHAPYIKEALNSVFNQTYPHLEIIVLDDGSKDESQKTIKELIQGRENITFFPHVENEGYTPTFNQGLKHAKGEFIIDFALDDVMLPDFIEKSVTRLTELGGDYGVSFSNAQYLNAQSEVTGDHNAILRKKGLIDQIPEGDVFEMILKRYFICTPTMVIRKVVFDRMGGYDEALAYEDFDFWVRSSRQFKYAYIDEVLVQKRKLKNSMSANRYRHRKNEQMGSIFKVCQKAFTLCKSKSELNALKERLYYEHRQCIRNEANTLATDYLVLIKAVGGDLVKTKFIGWLIGLGFSFSHKRKSFEF
ncbi:MAG: glycosyltransferase involved in cell wall biosynthesis [Roseivirga sp.]|jgi:glycosyltransferase involved in cell wall biosynthesis